MEELKKYIQNILRQLYLDYREDLGTTNELRLFSYLREDGLSFTPTGDRAVLWVDVPKENQELWKEKDLIPFLIKQFLPTEERKEEEQYDAEFASFLKDGIAAFYTKTFCENHNYNYIPEEELKANLEYAEDLLNHLSKTVAKNKVVFQYGYQEIMSYVQISTRSEEHPNGINYYAKYLNEYVKESDWPFIKAFITHYLKEGEEEIEDQLKSYKIMKKKQEIIRDLSLKLERKLKNNPEVLKTSLEELSMIFNNTLPGSNRGKSGATLSLINPYGYLKGSVIIVLTLLLGIAIAISLAKT